MQEKTMVYWIGMIVFALALIVLFETVWMVTVVMYPANRIEFLKGIIPVIVGCIIFLFIGIHMMREGKKK